MQSIAIGSRGTASVLAAVVDENVIASIDVSSSTDRCVFCFNSKSPDDHESIQNGRLSHVPSVSLTVAPSPIALPLASLPFVLLGSLRFD